MINLKRLPNHQKNEITELFLRRHWIEIIAILLYTLILFSIPFIFYIVLTNINVDWMDSFWGPIGALFASIYFLSSALIAITMFTDYYLDTWIVTNERIINIEQQGLFSRVVSTLHLNQVQDTTAETTGFLATILSYGDVHVQTAGSKERFLFKNIKL